jgi:predicted TIM-barrel fold metal-dependent hydrolase
MFIRSDRQEAWAMIIDCHAHVFQHWAGSCGHPSRAIHRKFMQKVQTRTSARTFRVRDGREMTGSFLYNDGDNSWAGLKHADFRVGIYGQLDFTIGGEDFYVQYMPVGMQEIVAPPELMLAQMTYAGIDHTVLQAGGGYGAMNDYNAFAQSQYPRKFTALLSIDEPRADQQTVLKEFERAHRQLGLQGIYYSLEHFARYGFEKNFDDPSFDDFWSRVDDWRLPVFIEATAIPNYNSQSYVENMVRLKTLMDRFARIRWLLVMEPPVRSFGMSGRWDFPNEALETYRHENLWIEIMFPITWGGVWEYPFVEAQSLIRDLRDKVGAEHLVWGSDMPNVERFCTYRQSLDYVRRHCSFLSASERDQILGINIDRILSISERLNALSS